MKKTHSAPVLENDYYPTILCNNVNVVINYVELVWNSEQLPDVL